MTEPTCFWREGDSIMVKKKELGHLKTDNQAYLLLLNSSTYWLQCRLNAQPYTSRLVLEQELLILTLDFCNY